MADHHDSIDPRTRAALAYLALWVGGLVMVFAEREDRDVRFHAMQSVVGLGGLWLLGVACWALGFVMLAFSADAFRLLLWAGNLAWGGMIVVWVICLYKAVRGERWSLPIAGPIAARWTGRG